MEKFLITGGAGFIGSHLSQRLLQEGKKVAIVDNLDDYYPAEYKRANLEAVSATGPHHFFPVDIRDADKLRGAFSEFKPDVVIHLAARPGVRMSFVQPEAYTSINVVGTTQVLEISRLCGVQKVLFASSSSVYGHTSLAPFREDAEHHPSSLGLCRHEGCGRGAGLHLFACVPAFGDLPETLYGLWPTPTPGPGDSEVCKDDSGGKGSPVFGDGSLERDYTYIDDIVDGILLALKVPGNFEVFNIGNSHPITHRRNGPNPGRRPPEPAL